MRMTDAYEFRRPFPLCEFTVWEDLDRQSLGSGGPGKRTSHHEPAPQKLPVLFCAVMVVLFSVESYVALYAIIGALGRSVATFWF